MRMRQPWRRRWLAAACLTSIAAPAAGGQSLISLTSPSLDIAQPGETDYDAAVSAPSDNYSVITTCTGSGGAGCRLFLQYGSNPQGQQVTMQYAVVSVSANCQGVAANPNGWSPVQSAVPVLSTRKNRVCLATFRFRVAPLSWTTYTAPGPVGGAYLQQVAFRLTRP